MDANNITDDTEVLLDVRPMIEKGEEPFSTIMATVASLDGRSLVLLAPFEPTPLEGVLSAQGFTYQAEQIGETDWRVRFTPSGTNPPTETPTETEPPAPEPQAAEPPATPAEDSEVLLDVRPLIEKGEEPFGTIMATVASLDGRSLVLLAPFEPTPLEGVLSAQGFTYQAEQIGETDWRVRFTPSGTNPPTETPTETEPPAPEPEAALATPSPYTIKRRTPVGETPSGASTGAGPSGSTGGDQASGVQASMMAMNPTLNVPPAWLPLGFMAAAGIGLIGFGTALAIVAVSVVDVPRSDHVISAVHLGVLAFLSTAVLGALHQFGPVVGAKPLRSINAGALTGVLFIPGAWLIPIGFATSHMVIVQVGGVLATVAVCIAAWNLSRPLSSTGKGAPIIGLRMAVFYLVVTAAFGITYAFNRGAFWFDMLDNRVLAHAHLGLLGWLGLAYVAVAEKLWPMFLLAHRPHVRAGERAVVTLSIGVPILALAVLWPSKVLTCVGTLVVLAGLGFHLSSLASVIKHRRRGLELLHGFVLTSAACLVVAAITGAIGVIASVGSFSEDVRYRVIPAEVLALILWLALAVIGHAHKIVPFISWNRLRDMGIMTGRDGRPLLFAHLVNQDLARVTFALAALAAASGIAGTLGAIPLLIRVAGIALGAAGVIAIANLVSGPLLMIKWHNQQTSADNSAAVDKDTAHVSNQ